MRRLLLTLAVLLAPAWAGAAISLDSTACSGGVASACPGGTQNATTGTTIATSAFSTAGAVDFVVVVSYNCASAVTSSVMSTTGTVDSWQRRTFKYLTGTFVNTAMVEVWTAHASAAFSGATITNTHSASSTCTGVMHVYPLTGADSTWPTVGTGTRDNGDSNSVMTFSIGTTASTSWVIGGIVEGNTATTLTPATNMTADRNAPASASTGGFAGRYTGTTGGSVTFGATGTSPYVVGAALEVKVSPGTPTASPAAGTFNSSQSVTLSSTIPSATICYTTDGSTPTANGAGTCTAGTTYSGAISVTALGTTTIKAIASDPLSVLPDSPVYSGAFVIQPITLVAAGSALSGTTTTSSRIPVKPAGIADGDWLVAFVSAKQPSQTCATSTTGWTMKASWTDGVNETICLACARVSGGGTSPGNPTITWASAGVAVAGIVAFRGVSTAGAVCDPIEVTGTPATNSATASTSTTGITPLTDGGIVLRFISGPYLTSSASGCFNYGGASCNGTITSSGFGTFTGIYNATSATTGTSGTSTNRLAMGVAYDWFTTAGATGNITSTAQFSSTYYSLALAVKPQYVVGGGSSVTFAVPAAAATAAAGTLTPTGASGFAVPGASATGTVGSITPTGKSSTALAAAAATGSAASLAPTGAASFSVLGAAASAAAGSLSVSGASQVALSGAATTALAGEIVASGVSASPVTFDVPAAVATADAQAVRTSGASLVALASATMDGSAGAISVIGKRAERFAVPSASTGGECQSESGTVRGGGTLRGGMP